MAKKVKVEKETRRLMEGIADLVKKKGDRYKFKTKSKKTIRKIRKTCPHWIVRKGKPEPTVVRDTDPSYWRCTICNTRFPVNPGTPESYQEGVNRALEMVNQMQFWSVHLGGDADDTKMFLRLKQDLPRFAKVSKHILKQVNKRAAWENNRKNSDILSQFDAYSGFNYRG